MRSGCRTGSPSLNALCLTGDSASCCPRPLGRSGCVYTAATSCPALTMCSSVGTANSGVPMKTIRTGSGPLTRLGKFSDLALDQVALEDTDVADVKPAFQVV